MQHASEVRLSCELRCPCENSHPRLWDINNYFSSDNSRQRIMLTTGMGWQATPHDLLRYSIYRINLDRNTCQVLNRSSTANDDFKQDVTAGANYEFALYSHLTLPLKLDSVGAAIHANSVKRGHPCGLYADVHVIGAIPKILEAIYEGRAKICIKILQYETIARSELRKRLSASFFARLSKAYYKQCEITQSEVDSFVSDKGYLSDVINVICLEISEVLRKSCAVDKIVDKDGSRIESHKIDWRVHARYYKGKNRKTIAERSDLYIATRAFNVHGKKSLTKPSNIKWDWLLRAAFESGKGALINSANPDVNKHPTSWSDFLTVVPLDERLVLNFSNGDRRPLLTFGVSFRVDDSVSMRVATRTLYLLEYLGIEELVRWALAFFMDKYNLKNENVISGLK